MKQGFLGTRLCTDMQFYTLDETKTITLLVIVTMMNYDGPLVVCTQVFHLGESCVWPMKAFKMLSIIELRAYANF